MVIDSHVSVSADLPKQRKAFETFPIWFDLFKFLNSTVYQLSSPKLCEDIISIEKE